MKGSALLADNISAMNDVGPTPSPATPCEPLCVVPLKKPSSDIALAEQAHAASSAHLTYRNGLLLSNVRVTTLFWGSAWGSDPLKQLAAKMNDFFTYILKSPLMDQLGEYDVAGYTVGSGSLIGTATVASADPPAAVDDAAIQAFLQAQIAAKAVPKPANDLLYFVYLPPGVVVAMGSGQSCQTFCGYHEQINGQTFYGVMPYPNCDGCLGGLAELDALTTTTSHELCEAITDPIPGQGWYDDNNGEIGDICAWRTKQLGEFQVQLEWSNKNNSCE